MLNSGRLHLVPQHTRQSNEDGLPRPMRPSLGGRVSDVTKLGREVVPNILVDYEGQNLRIQNSRLDFDMENDEDDLERDIGLLKGGGLRNSLPGINARVSNIKRLNSTGKIRMSEEGSEFGVEEIHNPFIQKDDVDDLVFVPFGDNQ